MYEVRLPIAYHYCYPFFMFYHSLSILILQKTASGMFTTGARKKTQKSTCTVWTQKHGNFSSNFLNDCVSGL